MQTNSEEFIHAGIDVAKAWNKFLDITDGLQVHQNL